MQLPIFPIWLRKDWLHLGVMRKHQQVELLPWESEGARKADGLTNSYCPYGKKIRDTCIARDALPGASLCVFFWKDKLKCRIGQGLTLNEQCPQLRKLAEGYHGGHVALWCQKITTASSQCLRLVIISNMYPGPLISFDDIISPKKCFQAFPTWNVGHLLPSVP